MLHIVDIINFIISLYDMVLYLLKVVPLTEHITFWDICKTLRNEELKYCNFFANFVPHTAEIRQVKKFKFNNFGLQQNSRNSHLLPTWNCSHLCKYCTNLGVSIHANTGTAVLLTNISISKMLKTESLILSSFLNKFIMLSLALRNDIILATTYTHTE